MSMAWEGCTDPTEQELERALAAIDDSWPILAQSEPWEDKARKENSQIDAAMVCIYVLGSVVVAFGLVWLGGAIGSAIDSLGKVAR
jgi:hypothetical protein